MNKITFIFKIKLFGLIFCLLISGNILAQSDTVSFLHISDLHVIFNLNIFQKDLAQSRQHYGQGVEPLKHFLQTMPQKTNSNLVVATGDLIDFYEGETKDEKMLDFQAEQFTRLSDNCTIPFLLTLGNHDISAYSWDDSTRMSSQNNAGQARATWIKNTPCFKNGTYYSKILKAGKTTFRLIFLDNGYNSVLPEEKMDIPYIDKAQLHWLEDQLKQSADDIEIILMHIPLTAAVTQPGSSCELYSALEINPSVKLILTGHNHKNIVRSFASKVNQKITQVQTGAFGQSVENWRRICLTENNILISFTGKTDNELTIPIK